MNRNVVIAFLFFVLCLGVVWHFSSFLKDSGIKCYAANFTPRKIADIHGYTANNYSVKQEKLAKAVMKPKIVQKRIPIGKKRVALTKEYTKLHYGFEKAFMDEPRAVVVHWTGGGGVDSVYSSFYKAELSPDSSAYQFHKKYGDVNLSAHFVVDRDGTIYQLFNEKYIARHCIGFNQHSIGIENVGGQNNQEDLTKAQLAANVSLIKYLKAKYPTIDLVIGHYEYQNYEDTEYFLEKIDSYRNPKLDPGPKFTKQLRENLKTPSK